MPRQPPYDPTIEQRAEKTKALVRELEELGSGNAKTASPPSVVDPEFAAMDACVRHLDALDKEARRRVLDYLMVRYPRFAKRQDGPQFRSPEEPA